MTTDKNEELNWANILDDLSEGQAVLLLGHDFLPDATQALAQTLRQALGEQLLYIYQRDGLFLFADNEAKVAAQREAARFYRQAKPDEALLRQIAELPFRLIVSANPDRNLADAFARWRIPHQFDYYSSQPKEEEPKLERPTAEQPLIYNICGNTEDRKSLILDYDDLFRLLTNLLADNNVPVSEVRRPLQNASSFIFLGFHFERWYTQMFMRYLNQNEHRPNSASHNYALKTNLEDEDVRKFIVQQFNVQHIGADASFLDELHRRFAQAYPERMRKLTEMRSQTAATVVQLIERNDTASAIAMINIFMAQIGPDEQELFVTTQAMHNQYLEEKKAPTTTQENLDILLNRVRRNLLTIAQQLP